MPLFKTFSSVNCKRFCLNARCLHCDSFLPLVTLGASVGQPEFEFEFGEEYKLRHLLKPTSTANYGLINSTC